MSGVCPVSRFQVVEQVARLNALWTIALAVAGLFFKWIYLFLIADFFIRGFIDPRKSILSRIDIRLIGLLKIEPKLINAGPKIFAAKIGFVFSVLVFTFLVSGLVLAADVKASILLLCAALEAFFSFCLGCKVYQMFGLERFKFL